MRLKKINQLKNGNLLFAFWANNAGRGSDNCTLQLVPAGTIRQDYSRNTENVLIEIRTGSWRGDVNLSRKVLKFLEIQKSDII
jgi:hypothetical protein